MKHLFHLRALLTLARDLYRYPKPTARAAYIAECKAAVAGLQPVTADDFDALSDALGMEPTPLCEAVREHMARIDAARADWAREVRRCADDELAEMTGGGEVA